MKATSPRQIARQFIHADQPPAAPADNATPCEPAVREVPRNAAADRPETAGKRSGGHRRFGWLAGDLAGGRPHNHLLDPAESPYLRKAIEMIMTGKSEQTVTRWLVEQHVPTVRGGRWTGTTVRNMVSNPAVCGYRMRGGELVLDPRTGEPAVGGWETVATPEEWRLVLRRYGGTAQRAGGSGALGGAGPYAAPGSHAPERRQIAQTRKYLLSGFLRCGRVKRSSGAVCGATLVGNPVTRGTPHGAYACTNPGCRGLARRMDLVDETVTGFVLAELVRRFGEAGGGGDAGEHGSYADWPDALLAGFTGRRWEEFDLRQKRIAIAAVVEAVLVRPLPEGRSTRAPFDPALLEVVWRGREARDEE
ncbi:recombinase family protein [Streptomyces sp.]|uniref:recombinase family protein n=1 Tax=Streptomyces sp. TaxID=1931 RepID=UPI002F4022E9